MMKSKTCTWNQYPDENVNYKSLHSYKLIVYGWHKGDRQFADLVVSWQRQQKNYRDYWAYPPLFFRCCCEIFRWKDEFKCKMLFRCYFVTKSKGLLVISPKVCNPAVANTTTNIFNISIESGSFPEDWIKANVVPIYKRGQRMISETTDLFLCALLLERLWGELLPTDCSYI